MSYEILDYTDYILTQVCDSTPSGIVEIIDVHMRRSAEAKHRIDIEGCVVRDLKGSVIPHPAISVEKEANKIVADLLMKNKL